MFGGISIVERIVEAYVGEYASGKSEVAINRALALKDQKRQVTLVDLDLVEPFYTLRPLKQMLIKKGIDVVAWETKETMGLGEAGSVIKPEMRWVLRRPGDIILDIGYGVEGAKVLNLVEGVTEEKNLHIYVVLNVGRPMTSSVDEIVQYVRDLGPVHGLINNSHLGNDTYLDFVKEGAAVIAKAAKTLNLPLIATYVDRKFKEELLDNSEMMGRPIRFIERYMINAFW